MWIGEEIFKISFRQALPIEKHVLGWNVTTPYSEISPRATATCAKFEENPPSGCLTITIENSGAGRPSLPPLSPEYKPVSLAGSLIICYITHTALWQEKYVPNVVVENIVAEPGLKQGHTMMLQTNTLQAIYLWCNNSLHLTVSDIQPRQDLKVKIITASSHINLDIAHIHTYPTNILARYQLPTPSNVIIAWSNQGLTMKLQTCTSKQWRYWESVSYTSLFPRYCLDKTSKFKFTTARSKVKSTSQHDEAHLNPQPLNRPSINYLHHGFRDMERTRF